MTKQQIKVESYWKVYVYYDIDYASFHYIYDDLRQLGATNNVISKIYNSMTKGKAKAVTYSNEDLHKSIVLFNKHSSMMDYINSVVHEAEHVKQSMLKAYNIKDEGEDPAYTIGYLVSKMLKVIVYY